MTHRHLTPRERAAQAAAAAAIARARARAGLNPPNTPDKPYPPGYDPHNWPPTPAAWRDRCQQIRQQIDEEKTMPGIDHRQAAAAIMRHAAVDVDGDTIRNWLHRRNATTTADDVQTVADLISTGRITVTWPGNTDDGSSTAAGPGSPSRAHGDERPTDEVRRLRAERDELTSRVATLRQIAQEAAALADKAPPRRTDAELAGIVANALRPHSDDHGLLALLTADTAAQIAVQALADAWALGPGGHCTQCGDALPRATGDPAPRCSTCWPAVEDVCR